MIKVENRESAHLKSRVYDKSVVPNVVSFNGLFAAITPLAKAAKNSEGLYDPILIRDTDSLIANFGDPRIDPEKYIDLYSIMQLVGNGGTCYVAKVPSGNAGIYAWNTCPGVPASAISLTVQADTDNKVWKSGTVNKKYNVLQVTRTPDGGDPIVLGTDKFTVTTTPSGDNFVYTVTISDSITTAADDTMAITTVAEASMGMTAYSSLTEEIIINAEISQAKPLSLKAYYLNIRVSNLVNGATNELASVKVKLDRTTTNQGLVNAINTAIGTFLSFELDDKSTANACEIVADGANSIVKTLLDKHAPYTGDPAERTNLLAPVNVSDYIAQTDAPSFNVTLNDYINTLNQYKAKKYVGCILSDLTAPIGNSTLCAPPDYEDRRTLHYNLKQIACERKDCNVILSAPYKETQDPNGTPFTLNEICDWVASQGGREALWEYGQSNTSDYAEQSFYLEMYASWLEWQCASIANGKAGSTKVKVAPSNLVINNILTSYRERGVQYPVAGDHYGTLPDSCTVLLNPKTKLERDQLVQYRINPIYDTGTRGIQIYGNETLNAGYTDLNAAHIARTLVYIRSTVDEYTETLKFLINSPTLWDTWNNYVSHVILDPLMSANGLAEYQTVMDETTTSPEDRANRTVRGNISLRFWQSAEIFDLSYVIYSTSTTIAEAQANNV
jgi:hypothetical protein